MEMNLPARPADRALYDLMVANEGITAAEVVAAARPKRSPMHSMFEWNDSVAAEKYREDQARRWMERIHIKFIRDDGTVVKVRAFHAVEQDGAALRDDGSRSPKRYIPLDMALRNESTWEFVMEDVRRAASQFLTKLEALEALKPGSLGDAQKLARLMRKWIDGQSAA